MDQYDYHDFLSSFRDAFAAWALKFLLGSALTGSSLLRDHEQIPAGEVYIEDL